MELIVFAVIVLVGSVALAGGIMIVIRKATGNAFDWFIHTFGNDHAAAEVEAKWQLREGSDRPQR